MLPASRPPCRVPGLWAKLCPPLHVTILLSEKQLLATTGFWWGLNSWRRHQRTTVPTSECFDWVWSALPSHEIGSAQLQSVFSWREYVEKTQKVHGEVAQTLQRVLLLVASSLSTHTSRGVPTDQMDGRGDQLSDGSLWCGGSSLRVGGEGITPRPQSQVSLKAGREGESCQWTELEQNKWLLLFWSERQPEEFTYTSDSFPPLTALGLFGNV